MNAEVLFQAIETAAVVVGVAFAVYETRRYRGERTREAAMELLHGFQTPEFAKALVLVYRLPDGLSKQHIESSIGEDLHLVYAMTTSWESIGVLVFRGAVSIDLVDDFFSGPIVVSWRKLQSFSSMSAVRLAGKLSGSGFSGWRSGLRSAKAQLPQCPPTSSIGIGGLAEVWPRFRSPVSGERSLLAASPRSGVSAFQGSTVATGSQVRLE